MKKILIIILFVVFVPVNCFAFSDSAKSSIVMDIDSGRILYSKKMHDKRLIASITKIMTCIIAIEKCNLNDNVKVGEEVLKMYGTNIYLELDEEMTVEDLLYGLMLRSGNDAAVVLATYISGSEEAFVKLMNEKAKTLGMNDTSFSNSHGLDENTQNYSSAYDMALLSSYAFNNKIYRKIIGTKKYVTKSSLKSYVWYNRMSLLGTYDKCIGGKNGYTPKAGKTLVSVAANDGLNLTAVSLNDSNIYENHENLFEKCFKEYKKYDIISKDNFKFDKGLIGDVYIKDNFSYPLRKEEIELVSTFMQINKNKGYGDIVINLSNEEIGKVQVYKKTKKKKEINLFQKIISEIF